jgi:hypothetical protein
MPLCAAFISIRRNGVIVDSPGRARLTPRFCREGKFIQLGARFTPSRIVTIHQRHEATIVTRDDQVHHLVHDYVLEKILGFLDQLRVQSDAARPMVATAPLCLHPLEMIRVDRHIEPALPLLDQGGHVVVQERLVPLMDHRALL